MACVKFIIMVALVSFYNSGVASSEIKIPDECIGKQFCDIKPEAYDKYQDDIKEKFLNIKKMWNLNEEDVEDGPVGRFTSESNCNYETKLVKPYYAIQPNGTTKMIVQTDYYQQRFKTTECWYSDDDSPDSDQCFKELTGTSTWKCKTKRTTIILYAYNTEKGTIERIPFDVPVCCYCSIPS